MMSVALKYSANEALATFILASDSESNDSFGDESSLETSGRYDPEGEPWFRGQNLMKYKKMTRIVDHRIFCDIENYDSYC